MKEEERSLLLGDSTFLPVMREDGLFRAFVCCFFLLGATGQAPQPLALTILSLEVLGWGSSLQGATVLLS